MKYLNVWCVILLALGLAACSGENATSTPTMQPTLPPPPTSQMQPTLPPPPLAGTATWTPQPTLSVDDLNSQQLIWLEALEARVGFSHQRFVDIANNLPPYSIYFSEYDVEPGVGQITFEDVVYTAIVVDRSVGAAYSSFLLFSGVNQEAELISEIGWESANFNRFDNNGTVISGFADRNGNGYPDIAIDIACLCSQGWGFVKILEIRANSEIVDLTPPSNDIPPRYFIDLNNDGILEIWAIADYGVPLGLPNCCEPDLIRYFGWNGEAYQEISASVPEMYYPLISGFQKGFRGFYGCERPSDRMYQMLIHYYAMGRLREGWTWLEPRLGLNTCDPDDMFGYEIDALLKWVNIRLAEEERRAITES